MKTPQLALSIAAALTLCACAAPAPPPPLTQLAPPQWLAAMPHQGSVTDLSLWWQHQGDALLAQLIDSAQSASPSLAAARSRLAQARTERIADGAALLPSLDAGANVSRSSKQSTLPMGTLSQLGLQSAWEIDLFGAGRATRDAAQARLESAQAGWYDARVSLAAEVANQYYSLRACEQLLSIADQDAASRSDTARLTDLTASGGLQSPANAALARASAAEASGRAIAQRSACALEVKVLVALSAMSEAQLQLALASQPGVAAPAIALPAVPARTLSQRPDVFSAERAVTAASAEMSATQAQRYPRLTLTGLVGIAQFRSGGSTLSVDTWSIGPLALTLPLFDGGRRRANVEAAAVRYDEAVIKYRASVRQAVSEVEQALINLASTDERSDYAHTALDGYRRAFAAFDSRYQNGLASLLELEESRRSRLAAENTMVNLERERNAAWVALYRAVGGGWNAATPPAVN